MIALSDITLKWFSQVQNYLEILNTDENQTTFTFVFGFGIIVIGGGVDRTN